MDREESFAPPFWVRALLTLVGLAILAGAGFMIVRWGSLFDKSIDEIGQRRKRDADIVRAQKTAAEEYLENIAFDMAFLLPDKPGGRLRLDFTITNKGAITIIKADATVSIALKDSKERHEEEVTVFDASELSVRPDRELFGGEERVVTRFLDVAPDWDLSDIQYGLKNVRVEVLETTPAPQ